MQLISLQISGFKSFANETKIQFAPGVTGVVGPNGCGKSNVVDSLRWVLGEQRSSVLRGERMENVIFNGTVKRKPLNLAEVRVKFDNASGRINLPYGEIEIARKLHRDGTSEYLINNNPCRLRDITDMLQDSGLGPNAYTILELKMIEDILREDGEGRRQLFEEASGIAKYKMRRRQALAKLAQTEEDLLRLADIVSEVERQVAALKRQVSRAKRYQELTAELKRAEVAYTVLEFDRLQRELDPMRHALADASGHAEGSNSHLRQFEAKVEQIRAEQLESDQKLAHQRQDLQETVAAISALEADKAGTEARLTAAREGLERAQRQVILSRDRLGTLEARKDGLTKDRSDAQMELEVVKTVLKEAENKFQTSQAQLKQLEATYKETDSKLAALNKTQANLEGERAKLLEGIARQKGRRESAHQTREQVATERTDLEQRTAAVRTQLEQAEQYESEARKAHDTHAALGENLTKNREALAQQIEESERLIHATSSHISLLQTLEQRGPRGTAQITLIREQIAPHKLIADVTIVDEKFNRAIHAALGNSAYHMMVKTEQELLTAVEKLHESEAGKAGFKLPFIISELTISATPSGSLGWATQFVDAGTDGENLQPLLASCLVVNSLEDAFELKSFLVEHRCRAVTLAGDWLDWTGLCYAGSMEVDTPSDLGLSRQIESLRETLSKVKLDREELSLAMEQVKSEIGNWKQQLSALAGEVESRKQVLAKQRSEQLRIETLLHALSQRDQAAVQLIGESESAEHALRNDIERLVVALDESRVAISETQIVIEGLSEEVWQARQENGAARDAYHEQARVVDGVNHRLQLLDAEGERLKTTEFDLAETIRTNSEQGENSANTIAASEVQLRGIAEKLRELFVTRDERYRIVDEAQRTKDAANSEVRAMEEQLKRLRSSREAAIDDQRKLEVSIAKIEGELESLIMSARNQHGIELSGDEEAKAIADLREVATGSDIITELRTKIENLGTVNLLAVEEYDKETARLDGMLSNRADLLSAKATLEETINKINETAEARFLHTFEAVRANFQSLFSEFFPAGEADLILSGKDLLEADITMWANPSGKRLKSLTLMSGGEKTMTAIALLFSLYQVKPSPFCVLDEVDAPLDDANIDRFTRMIHRHSDHTQFIMITHNKRTMEIADNLYGVTMQEEGVSKTVSVRLLKPMEPVVHEAQSAATR
ncbi:MAG: chromosome segregation protein SMC [bacterium]|nr:chromosome segregation protein SMC [bacterium]